MVKWILIFALIIQPNKENGDQTLSEHQTIAFSNTLQQVILAFVIEWVSCFQV